MRLAQKGDTVVIQRVTQGGQTLPGEKPKEQIVDPKNVTGAKCEGAFVGKTIFVAAGGYILYYKVRSISPAKTQAV